ncbi:lipocalin family protein [Niabella ginsengisoli]|uniref:Lipocalin family protein n=1 Tax=Niabella ginsengisoli TaxID=522298 RepID=A0ABS9SFU1_9BACT|nr:lipocalin family protein [Niabella ginsengisoli]MCH5597215.1 lipocalin family protein [Niabella ginsengisoli]
MKKKYVFIGAGIIVATGIFIYANTGRNIPKGITAISNFQQERYLGKWYEIARFDFRFEKNMSHVTAEYLLNDDGSIKVINSGYDFKKYKRKQSIGKAKFVGDEDVAMLKVSFFGPFYAGYNVIAIDENYQYALVCGKNRKYLWLLSRDKTMPEPIKDKYLAVAKRAGFDISDLVWTKQN